MSFYFFGVDGAILDSFNLVFFIVADIEFWLWLWK